MSDLPEHVLRDVATLDHVREHLAGRHAGPEDYRTECLGCDHFRLDTELAQMRDAFDRERIRAEMMAYQRGAVLDAVHRMQLGNHTIADIAGRVEEIFKAGMTAEVERGYGEQVARLTGERDDALQMVLALTGEAPCDLQHGKCHEHGWTADTPCIKARAEEFLAHQSTSDSMTPQSVGTAHAAAPDKPGPAETAARS